MFGGDLDGRESIPLGVQLVPEPLAFDLEVVAQLLEDEEARVALEDILDVGVGCRRRLAVE